MTEPNFWKNQRETACCPARSVLRCAITSVAVHSHVKPPPLLTMDNPGTPGLRLLSLELSYSWSHPDGGGIRGLSMLIILEDLMLKLKVAEDLPDVPCPCDYFDLIGGTSTGGLIALMLGRLRMSVKDAVKAYGELSKEVFSDVKSQGSDGRFKASKLEKAIKGIVGAHSALQDPEEGMEDTRENPCKTSVQRILSRAPMLKKILNLVFPAMDCTIWQAGRATSAAPTFFKQIRIGPPGIEEAFVDGGMGQNNPIAALLLEAQVVFPDHQIACIISLGTGQPHTIKIPTPSLLKRLFPLDVIEAIKGIATDCEKQHQLSAHHFDPVPHVYFRFNVERGMQDIQLNQWERLGDVAANTRQYLLSHPTQNQLVDAVKSVVEKIGRVSTQSLNAVPTAVEFQQFNPALALLRCPPPSQIFQGRQDILAKMDEFTKQFFINASSLQTLDTTLKNIAIAHKIGTSSEDGLLWLISQREEWMLLFDNADNPSIDLFHFFPKCTHGNIIVTSRNPGLAVHGPRSQSRVGDMNETDAIDLLLLSAVKEKSIESTQSASEIVKVFHLQGSPSRMGIYWNHAKLLSQHSAQSHADYRWTVYTTWQISFGQLSKAAASIPETIFEQAAESTIYSDEQEAQTLQEARKFLQNFLSVSGTWDPQQFMDVIGEIRAYSLIDTHDISDTLSIHPLVHSWCRHTLDDEPIARQCMTDIMGMSIRLTQDAYLSRIGLMSHVDSLIQDQMTIKSVFQTEYTHVYFDSGRFTEAESLTVMVLEKRMQLLGANHPDTLSAMGNLATTYRELGRYREAEPLESIVLEKRKQLLGADHPDTLLTMANLAATYHELGRHQEADPLESIVLEKRKQLLGADHPDTLSAMGYLAATYHTLGRSQEAEPLESMVLEKRKQLLGADHPDTLSAMGNLAATYRTLGRSQEAEPLESIVLEKRKQVLGADHPHTLWAMANLAATYRTLARYQEAETLENIVLEKQEQLLGADHPDTLSAMANLAVTYCELGRYQEAEPLESIVLEKRKQVLGADHPHTLWAMENLAATYRTLARYQEAETLENIVLEKQEQLLGADHPDTLSAMANLAATYCELGRYQEAEPLESIVLEKRKQVLGPDHPDTLMAMANLAATSRELERYQEAEPLDSIVLEKQKQVLGADHPDTLLAMGNLAATYHTLGRYQEAEPLESTVLEKRKQLLGADHPDTLTAMANLAFTYRELGRYQEAEPLERIVLEKRKQLLGADHPDTLSAMGNLAVTYRKLGKYPEAEPLQSIVLEKQKQLLGADHPEHSVIYYGTGRSHEAEPLEVIVLEKRKQLLSADHPDTLLAMGNLAATYRNLGRSQEAEPLEGIVLEKWKQLLGADHPDTLSAMGNLAVTYHTLGRSHEAEPLESIVLEKRKQVLGADHPDTLLAMANLAATYCELGRYQEAEPLDIIVLEKRKQLFGADHPDTLSAMANLAGTYCELGRYQEAEPLESIVLEKRKQVLGPDHPATLMAMANLAATYRELERYQEAEHLQAQYDKLVGNDNGDSEA
ncbi:hypothetical protein B0H13DRAFT_1915667 [Mycena leptocephala]|nr:hypothetical protein B0H13DRAFT_1915667 [Mycena leptocephala]